MIGNSRWHWAWFIEQELQFAWDTEYLSAAVVQNLASYQDISNFSRKILAPRSIESASLPPIYLASVVPQATIMWQAYPKLHKITLNQVPLLAVYPTLGIDRALALWGAGATWGFPALVIDAGTALTFTGAKCDRTLVGGAIVPGVCLQLQSLGEKAAALPIIDTPTSLPSRWALNTPESIQSGVIYTLIAGIKGFICAWWQEFPESCIAITGGDRALLLEYLQAQYPDIAAKIISAPYLIFQGICCYWVSREEEGQR